MTVVLSSISDGNPLLEKVRRIKLLVFDFDGVFTDNKVLVLEDGREAVFCSRADGMGLTAAREAGFDSFVLSKEKNPVVSARCRKLKIDCIQGCDGKAERLGLEAARRGVGLDEIAYLGNDINDVECLRIVGLPVCVADAYAEAVACSLLVTSRPGGQGAVREFCDFMVAVSKKLCGETR